MADYHFDPSDEYLIFGYIRECESLLNEDLYFDMSKTISFLSMMYYRTKVPEFDIGDCVTLHRGKTGIVKYIGNTDFAKGELIGLQLDTWTPAGHNGKVRGRKYFDAPDGYGYFTRRSNIQRKIVSKTYWPTISTNVQQKLSTLYNLSPLYIGQNVCFIDDETKFGVIRYFGYPQYTERK